MDNTMYKIEGGFIKGLAFGVRYDGSFVGKRFDLELGFIWIGFNFYSKLEQEQYPMKWFRWF
jgi:hypothetical protein